MPMRVVYAPFLVSLQPSVVRAVYQQRGFGCGEVVVGLGGSRARDAVNKLAARSDARARQRLAGDAVVA
eukprot:764532-Pleurochrysis_carterae.AAC.1